MENSSEPNVNTGKLDASQYYNNIIMGFIIIKKLLTSFFSVIIRKTGEAYKEFNELSNESLKEFRKDE